MISLAESGDVTAFSWLGPIPHPAVLARFNEVDDTFAERIVSMAEAEVYAHTDAVRAVSRAEARAVTAGAIVTVTVPVLGLVAAIVLIVLGLAGVALLAAVPALLIGVAQIVQAVRGDGSAADDTEEDGGH